MSLSAIDLAAELIRFDTINPPGQEAACTDHHARMLRSEEHTSELQSPYDLVCRLLLEKTNRNSEQIICITNIKKNNNPIIHTSSSQLYIRPSKITPILLFFNATATTEIYTLSLHDALPISARSNA